MLLYVLRMNRSSFDFIGVAILFSVSLNQQLLKWQLQYSKCKFDVFLIKSNMNKVKFLAVRWQSLTFLHQSIALEDNVQITNRIL